jgi:biotin transport system substrate-specific component
MADAILPKATLLRNILLVLSFSGLIALSARLSLTVPWSPIPITGQTFAVLLTGALLGSRLGAMSILAYLAEGAMGLPVFAYGLGGPAILTGPTGGFLIGFVPMAFIVGYLCERGWDRRPWTAAPAMLAGSVVLYIFGLSWLAYYVPSNALLAAGLTPFIPGDLTKIALATMALPSAWALASRARGW